jgi:glycine/D-amino acid oxidase-like deaminating enzyme
MDAFDVVIIGGGAAGLTDALVLARIADGPVVRRYALFVPPPLSLKPAPSPRQRGRRHGWFWGAGTVVA